MSDEHKSDELHAFLRFVTLGSELMHGGLIISGASLKVLSFRRGRFVGVSILLFSQ